MLNSTDIRKVCNEKGIRMIDFKMTDLDGKVASYHNPCRKVRRRHFRLWHWV